MRAIVQNRYGGPETLRLLDRDVPAPGEGQARIRVAAAGIDAGILHLLEGRPLPVRLALPLKGSRVLGTDVAGTIDALGEGMTGLRVGDEVLGVTLQPHGALADYALARADQVVRRPASLSPVEAAALPVSGIAALRAVRRVAAVRAGQRVLVLGAAGGVGHFAVQIARANGARLMGACSTGKVDLVAGLGADDVVDYTARDPLESGPFDAIIDTGGNRPLRNLRRALAPRGALVLVGAEPEHAPMGGMGRSLLAALTNPFTRQRLQMLVSTEDRGSLEELVALAAAGAVRPVVTATFPLDRAADAIRGLGRGRGTGKVVVEVGDAA